MSRLIEMRLGIAKLQDRLFFMEESDDEYIEYSAILNQKISELGMTAEHSVQYFTDLLVSQELEAENAKKISDRANKKLKTANNKVENTKKFIKKLIIENGLTKVKTDYKTMSIQNGRKVVSIPDDFDPKTLPDELKTVIPEKVTCNKSAITKALKEGQKVLNLELIEGDKIMVGR